LAAPRRLTVCSKQRPVTTCRYAHARPDGSSGAAPFGMANTEANHRYRRTNLHGFLYVTINRQRTYTAAKVL